jgi:hypothetical protein
VADIITLHCSHRYNRKLRRAADYADEVMNSRPGRNAASSRGRRKLPGAMKARDAEEVCIRTVEAMTGEEILHLRDCEDCRNTRQQVINKWADLNLHLQQRHIPTCRSVSPEQFLRDVSDRQAAKLRKACEELLALHEAADVIKSKGELQDDEFHDMFFNHCR